LSDEQLGKDNLTTVRGRFFMLVVVAGGEVLLL